MVQLLSLVVLPAVSTGSQSLCYCPCLTRWSLHLPIQLRPDFKNTCTAPSLVPNTLYVITKSTVVPSPITPAPTTHTVECIKTHIVPNSSFPIPSNDNKVHYVCNLPTSNSDLTPSSQKEHRKLKCRLPKGHSFRGSW